MPSIPPLQLGIFLAALALGAAQAAEPPKNQPPAPEHSVAASVATALPACPPATGSHLRRINTTGNCDEAAPTAFVQSYSRDELLGADPFDLARALSHLNAAVQLHQ